jgi:hypothetical protein
LGIELQITGRVVQDLDNGLATQQILPRKCRPVGLSELKGQSFLRRNCARRKQDHDEKQHTCTAQKNP